MPVLTRGFLCPACGKETKVLEKRDKFRTRLCKQGHKFKTEEVIAELPGNKWIAELEKGLEEDEL